MPKILIRSLENAPVAQPPRHGMSGSGFAVSPVIAGPADPLHLQRLCLTPPATLAWSDSGRGFILYVKSGAVEVEGQEVGAGGSITAEHAAALRLTAGVHAELLMFSQGPAGELGTQGAGGHIHILPPQSVPRRKHYAGYEHIGGALFADASCPTCSLWLHENSFWGNHGADLHTHSEDEIIVVLTGQVILGRQSHGPGTVIAVAAHTVYGFATDGDGTTIINFRPASPTYQSRNAARTSIDEREFHVRQLGSPAPLTVRSPGSTTA